MRRRPWPILLIALLQVVVEPVGGIVLNASAASMAPGRYALGLLSHGAFSSMGTLLSLMGIPVVMALAILAMRRWSFALFAGCAAFLAYRDYSLVTLPHPPALAVAAVFLTDLSFVGYFLLPALAAANLNPRLRWWDAAPRYAVRLIGRLEPDRGQSFPCRLENISIGGAFLSCPSPLRMRSIAMGATCWIRVSGPVEQSSQIFTFKVRIAFSTSTGPQAVGYGVQFLEMSDPMRLALIQMLRRLRRSGCAVNREDNSWQVFKTWFWTLVRAGSELLPERAEAARPATPVLPPSPPTQPSRARLTRDGA